MKRFVVTKPDHRVRFSVSPLWVVLSLLLAVAVAGIVACSHGDSLVIAVEPVSFEAETSMTAEGEAQRDTQSATNTAAWRAGLPSRGFQTHPLLRLTLALHRIHPLQSGHARRLVAWSPHVGDGDDPADRLRALVGLER
jgi:hypothetical protein